jgi:hypothetical protein
MDNEPADDSMMSQRGRPILLWLSALLQPAERDAVLGDLAECGERSDRAIAGVLGLVVRRNTAVLLDLRLWVAMGLLILPVSFLLAVIVRSTAGQGAVYSWMYLNNWDWALTTNAGFWFVLRETATKFGVACLLLACWSWSGGFLFGRLPNAILRASRNAFIVLLAVFQLGDAPARFIRLWMHFHGLPLLPLLPDPNAPVTANGFYRVFFPWIILATLVILPAISGIRQGNQALLHGRKMLVVLVTAAATSLLILLVQMPGFGLLLNVNVREWFWHNRNAMQVLSLLACWPISYMIAMSFQRYRQHRHARAQ